MVPSTALPPASPGAPRPAPPWLPLLAALVCAAFGGWLLWGPIPPAERLPRAPETLFPLRDLAVATDLQAFERRQVMVSGRFTGQTVLLPGRMAGHRGTYVLTPLVERGSSGLAILVLRGWVPAGTTLDAVLKRTPRHEIGIQGRLLPPEQAAWLGLADVPVVPLMLLQEPGAQWTEQDIRQDFFQRRWPQFHPLDRLIAPAAWLLLGLAGGLLALAALRWRRSPL